MSDQNPKYIKGRGAQINTHNPFDPSIRHENPNVFDDPDYQVKTTYIESHPKTIINKVTSPDVPFNYSINPYQGCEHGCVYCYARNTHPYWGYSAGLDFETKILIKKNAPQLLRKKFNSKSWIADPISLSGNTDCYQPAESTFKITRSLLEVFREFGHPVSIITKNSLILRDLDILKDLHKHNLVSVAISINTLDDTIRSFLEPRTATIKKRLETVKALSDIGIPVTVLAAPIIPRLTDDNIFPLVEKCAEAGAQSIHHLIVRLNGDVAAIFENWARQTFPDRADKMLNQIAATHGGQLNDSVFGHRMRGSGAYADIIAQQFSIARKKYFADRKTHQLNLDRFEQLRNPQMKLF